MTEAFSLRLTPLTPPIDRRVADNGRGPRGPQVAFARVILSNERRGTDGQMGKRAYIPLWQKPEKSPSVAQRASSKS
ncbi:hypothetical protein L596_011086 [Steinernema carpocapsae]|uniref:Uncharacterized protein n=1 Tax=Steinernema carpocapsae TaxID=34508 RepID=A0A4U5NTA8_STECR|nr:hypothetical protein L596_011086 [Steinernema carpocapsae]